MLSTEEQLTVDTYNQIAQNWAGALDEDFWQQEYKQFYKYLSGGKILDLGCGSGRDSKYLTALGFEIVGVDISEEMIKLAKIKNPTATFLVKSFYDLDFAPGSFDGIWAACSLIHIPREKIKNALVKIKTFIRPKGAGFIAIKEGSGQKMVKWKDSGKKRFFVYHSDKEFSQILKDCGFEILEKGKKYSSSINRQETDYLTYYIKAI